MAARRRSKPPPLTNTDRVERLISTLDLDERGDAFAGVALTLAGYLDEGAGMATAAVARELRATVEALTSDGGDAADDVLAGLSTPVRHPAKPAKANPRA